MSAALVKELRERTGLGLLECSHRSPLFDGVIDSARDRLRRLLQLDDMVNTYYALRPQAVAKLRG